MNRQTINAAVDTFLGLVTLGLLLTGLLMAFVLPPGSNQRWALWGWSRHDWGDLHLWLAYAMLAGLVIHLVLHWQWIVSMVRRLVMRRRGSAGPGPRRLGGVLTALCVVGLIVGFWAWADASVAPRDAAATSAAARPAAAAHAAAAHDYSTIRGSMELAEVCRLTGWPLPQLLERLGLPGDTPPDARLGRTCRDHGISMSHARQRLGLDPDESRDSIGD